MKTLPANPLPTLADEIIRLLPEHPSGLTVVSVSRRLGADIASVRNAVRLLNVDGRAVLMRRVDSRENFVVPASSVTRSSAPVGLRCCIHCGTAFKIAKWHCPARRGERFAYSPKRTCSQKCAGLVANRDGKRFITQAQKDLCVSLRLEHNLSAPEIGRRVGITSHSAYRILAGCPAWIPTKRKPVRGTEWTTEQDALLRRMYPAADQDEITQRLPGHTWIAIERRASSLKVRRRRCEARGHKRRVHPVVAQLLSIREQAGIARTDLSRRCGIHINQILGWELGKSAPRLDDVSQWASSFGLEIVLSEERA